MENAAGIFVDNSNMPEEKSVEVGVSEERIEEKAVLGSDGLNELEGEEVFEEAMDVQEHLQEQGTKASFWDDAVVGENRKSETINDLGLEGVDKSPSGGHEFEKFEEAIGVLIEVGKHEEEDEAVVINEGKVRDLVGGNSVDGTEMTSGIDDGGTDIKPMTNEVNGSDDGLVVSRDDGGKENFEIGANGEIEATKSGDKIDIKDEIHLETASNMEILEKATSVQELDINTLVTEGQDGGKGELQNASSSPSLKLHDDKGMKRDEENIYSEYRELDSNELKNVTVSVDAIHGEDNSLELSNTNRDHKDYRNGDVKEDAADGLLLEHDGESGEMKNTLSDLQTSVEERSVKSDIGDPLSLDKSTIEKAQVIQASVADSRVENDKDFESQKVVDKAREVSNDDAIAKGPEKEDGKNPEAQTTTQVKRDQEIQQAQERASSSAKSTDSAPAPAPARPAGLGRAAPLLEPAPRVVQQPRVNGTLSHMQNQQLEEPVNGDPEEHGETREQLQMIRVKFLRLAHRLGQTPHNVVVAQVLYRLGLAEQLRGRNGGRVGAFSFDRASAMAEQLEAAGNEPLDFSCTIMVLGKTGVGKSATINSIFDEVKFGTDAFQTGTKRVQDVVGTVQGIKVRVIDTPGLLSSWSDQRQNEKILHSVKRFIKKTPPDIVLYLDRLDMQSRDFSDMPLLRTITEIFGPSIWFNAIVVLTHAASAPPEGPNGTASSYDMFVTQRSHVVQQAIRQAAGDMRLMNPVSLVENHSACRTNRAGQRVLPNGQVWKPHLLLLSFASKILAEANALLKLQDTPPGKPYSTRSRAPPLPFLLSSLLQSRPQLKLPEEQFGDDDSVDDDLDESSDSDDESEFDELPPFKRLTKAQLAKLSKAQKKAYFDELEYREMLFMKRQLKEERKRRKLMKKMAAAAKDMPSDYGENTEEESAGAASVPVPMPDLALPASFDSDNPTHRYRYLDSSNQWLVRPVLETHGWDHDVGYEGINVERLFVVKGKIPLSFSGQVTKDKKDANVQMEVASSLKHGEGKATSLGFDMQTVGKDLAYTLRSETKFANFRKNKATAGISVTLLGDSLSAGLKMEDKLIANKRFQLVVTGGAMTGRGDIACGGSLEAQLRDKDYPLGRSLSTLGLSIMDWHGDLAIGCNIQSQIPVGRYSNLIARANLNNRGAGQVSIRLNSSEQLQIALVGLVPLLRKLLSYHQQPQLGQ
ncbi:hypothetical protein FEM48_Zijuj09G0173100 [Ziziphus jujuba var. spinosa]|uniref:AIG1-type G domain-containing protein n=1 Tax=Ziziphus jujuba var. spinosa TaxID=714518 RepID=A0A978UUA2_ZIZJJ|nr:translocase of chloroplast 120, chloroplastic-like [Ziziphus jujuba var. spinosa]KAH7518452.1 hypothetical protein FEM48_Zijuj09G0173100 [Ziziphus jujuba var. spinosa]